MTICQLMAIKFTSYVCVGLLSVSLSIYLCVCVCVYVCKSVAVWIINNAIHFGLGYSVHSTATGTWLTKLNTLH